MFLLKVYYFKIFSECCVFGVYVDVEQRETEYVCVYHRETKMRFSLMFVYVCAYEWVCVSMFKAVGTQTHTSLIATPFPSLYVRKFTPVFFAATGSESGSLPDALCPSGSHLPSGSHTHLDCSEVRLASIDMAIWGKPQQMPASMLYCCFSRNVKW